MRRQIKKLATDKKGLIIFVSVFGLLGIFVTLATRAMPPFSSLEPENASLANGATSGNDANASGGSYAQFGGEEPGGELWIPGYSGTGGGPDVGPTGSPSQTINSHLSITSAGTHVYENVRVTGGVSMDGTAARTVIFRNCWIENAGGFFGIVGPDWNGNSTLLIEDCQIGSASGNGIQNCIAGTHITVKRTKIVGCEDGIKAGGSSLYEQVHITSLRPRTQDAASAHSDGFQDAGAGDWVLRWSHIDISNTTLTLPNSAIIIKADLWAIDNVTVENSILNGGGWMVDVSPGNYGPQPVPTNVTIRNTGFGNTFGFGRFAEGAPVNVTWQGNYLSGTTNCINKGGQVTGSGCGPGD